MSISRTFGLDKSQVTFPSLSFRKTICQYKELPLASLVSFKTCKLFSISETGMIDDLSNLRTMCLAGYDIPTSILWHPKNMLCCVFVTILLKPVTFLNEFFVTFLEAVADIFKEYETQHYILRLRCSEVTTKPIRTIPNAVFYRFFLNYFCFLSHILFFYISIRVNILSLTYLPLLFFGYIVLFLDYFNTVFYLSCPLLTD